jgi:hypothetical protein
VFELTTFRLRDDADDATFRELDGRVQVELAYQQPGLLRRTLGRHDDGRWLVLTVWRSADDGASAARAFDASPLWDEYVALFEPGSLVVERFHGLD